MGLLSLFSREQPGPQTLPSSDRRLKDFRYMWRSLPPAVDVPLDQPLRHIVAVGADYRSDGSLNHRDRAWLSHTLEYCHRNKVTVPPDFTFTPVNYLNGHDFLDPRLTVKADILISCFIADKNKWTKGQLKRATSEVRYDREFVFSPLHSPTAWRDAAERTGARLIVAFQRDREIGVAHFSGNVYKSAHMQTVDAPPSDNGDRVYWMGPLLRSDLATEIARRKAPARAESSTLVPA